MKFNIVDDSFGTDKSLVAGKTPKYIEWDKECTQSGPIFYTNKVAYTKFKPQNCENFFILTEPTTILQYNPDIVESILDRFKIMFTHDSRYINKWPDKCKWIPGGGIWIGGTLGGGKIKIGQKTKLCSMLSSRKIFCDLHLLRFRLMQYVLSNDKIDKFGTIYGDGSWVQTNDTLENYYFSIIIENHIDDLYFTEKLLNCFATGTIPIYVGARNISSIFNGDGIIKLDIFDKNMSQIYDEVDKVLKMISPEYYHYCLPAVLENFDKCKEFEILEDFIYTKYGDLL